MKGLRLVIVVVAAAVPIACHWIRDIDALSADYGKDASGGDGSADGPASDDGGTNDAVAPDATLLTECELTTLYAGDAGQYFRLAISNGQLFVAAGELKAHADSGAVTRLDLSDGGAARISSGHRIAYALAAAADYVFVLNKKGLPNPELRIVEQGTLGTMVLSGSLHESLPSTAEGFYAFSPTANDIRFFSADAVLQPAQKSAILPPSQVVASGKRIVVIGGEVPPDIVGVEEPDEPIGGEPDSGGGDPGPPSRIVSYAKWADIPSGFECEFDAGVGRIFSPTLPRNDDAGAILYWAHLDAGPPKLRALDLTNCREQADAAPSSARLKALATNGEHVFAGYIRFDGGPSPGAVLYDKTNLQVPLCVRDFPDAGGFDPPVFDGNDVYFVVKPNVYRWRIKQTVKSGP